MVTANNSKHNSSSSLSNSRNRDVLILRERSFYEQISSRHVGPLRGMFFFACLTVFLLLLFFIDAIASGLFPDWLPDFMPKSAQPTYLAAGLATLIAALLTVIFKIYDAISHRMGVTDLFTNEVLGICRAMSSLNIPEVFIRMFFDLRIQGFADQPRKEEYFPFFAEMSQELGFLTRNAVAQTTSFYIFFKASRDASGSLALWSNYNGLGWTSEQITAQKRVDVFNIIYMVFLCFEAALYALQELVEDRVELEHYRVLLNRNIVLGYVFLNYALEQYQVGGASNQEYLSYVNNRRRYELVNRDIELLKEVEEQFKNIRERCPT